MSLDALSALGDLLPENKPKAELPEVRPEDIVSVRVQTLTATEFTAFYLL